MKPTTSRTTILIGLAAIAALTAFFFVTVRRGGLTNRNELILANPPIERLIFVKKVGGEFAPEQRQKIEEFKANLLARAGLGVKLTKQEKEIFNVVISDREVMFPNGDIVVNQPVLKFSAEEINLISNALKR